MEREKYYTLFDSEIGKIALIWNSAGLVGLVLPEKNKTLTVTKAIQLHDCKTSKTIPSFIRDLIGNLGRYLSGKSADFSTIPIDFSSVTPFRVKVYRRLLKFSAGSTLSYGDLAKKVGSPGGARAVGSAMAHNPFPIIIPCHRVLPATGKIGHYSAYGGEKLKQKLLNLEGVTI